MESETADPKGFLFPLQTWVYRKYDNQKEIFDEIDLRQEFVDRNEYPADRRRQFG